LFSKNAAAGDGVVKVITSFEANNTAYIVMDYLEGQSLDTILQGHPNGLPEENVIFILRKLLVALACVHDNQLLHRDIKPANILLRKDGSPVLLDFGAARVVQPGGSGQYSQIFTESYAPIEQIAGHAQGRYSDLYSLGATCYNMIAGQRFRGAATASARASAIARNEPDPLVPAVTLGAGRYSETLLKAIDILMRIAPEQRPQSVADFLPSLDGDSDKTKILVKPAPPAVDLDATIIRPAPASSDVPSFRADDVSMQPTVIGRPAAPPLSYTAPASYASSPASYALPPAPAKAKGASLLPILAGAVLALAVAGGGIYLLTKKSETTTTTTVDNHRDPNNQITQDARPQDKADQAYGRGDYVTAAPLYQTAAQGGDTHSQYRLGYMYEYGQALPQSYAKAYEWYSKAAAQGLKDAEFQVGYLSQHGLGILKNPAAALQWYQQGAAQGSAPAQYQLGLMYQMGQQVPLNYPEAMRQYRAAADQGLPDAQYKVGRFYADGLSVNVDMATARDWMTKAAAGGSGEAKAWLATH
jgi:serine/threonine protein kinase